MKNNQFRNRLAATLISGLLITGCSSEPDDHSHAAGDGHEAEAADFPRGPHNGRLLTDGDLAIEVTIFEAGRPPQFRLFAYKDGALLDPAQVEAKVTLTRLDGEENVFAFAAEADHLSGDGVVTEPHSFDVKVEARHAGHAHSWTYGSYEGRTAISAGMAAEVGIEVAPVGPAMIEETIELLGRVEFAPDAESTLRARFPGKVLAVTKSEGDRVKKGELLARVESNDSLKPYDIVAPMDGVMVKRTAQVGDVVYDTPLFVIGDLSRLRVDFHVYPGDLGIVQPGQMVAVRSIDGGRTAETELEAYLPTAESATQTMIVHAPLMNPDERWVPGMTVKGNVVVSREEVPLAVRTDALQRFRDFTVVFAQVGEEYEVRMLDLGRQTPEWTEVLGGIKPGQPYVTVNSFLVKADIEKSGASHDH
ncbi:efflux RND transporter periplasmic adaptor subunit [Gimibacter soli]|uniref:Efflux RND transporter periplasmic adaptor subunit n=1 Tax=Gimibacter soli TaxID=3024400 RepID=A0AAE9XP33_9PROT|nr:efflux RND transporter periplasmic adaptor subunit [Gimibacter soli]WCL53869.1 efflux RND transporter periplasmic adaptor subunit [Gimibacter soli]